MLAGVRKLLHPVCILLNWVIQKYDLHFILHVKKSQNMSLKNNISRFLSFPLSLQKVGVFTSEKHNTAGNGIAIV